MKQCIKVCHRAQFWVPFSLIFFINDIFYSVDFSTIYNYADDNTLSYADYDLNNVISKLESDSQKMLDWFANNLRDRPFNLKAGVMVFCFVQKFFYGQHKS